MTNTQNQPAPLPRRKNLSLRLAIARLRTKGVLAPLQMMPRR